MSAAAGGGEGPVRARTDGPHRSGTDPADPPDPGRERGQPDLLARLACGDQVVGELRAALRRPAHAYLFVGPRGTGKKEAAVAFGAALLCRAGGCGTCRDCERALRGVHPDLLVVERTGPFIAVEDARVITRLAVRSPFEAERQVLVLCDFHLVDRAAPALLKTIEEPPASTVFVVLAERLAPELVTIASRCVVVEFPPLPAGAVEAALVRAGVDPALAARAASASGGRLDRAKLLAADPGFAGRLEAWRRVPERLDGTGAAVVAVAQELEGLLDAATEPVRRRQEAELEAERAEAAERGAGAGRREVAERHRREQRRVRQEELRAGLAELAAAYRERLVGGLGDRSAARAARDAALEALGAIEATGRALERNPNERLALEALLVRLSLVGSGHPAVRPRPVGSAGVARVRARLASRASPR